MADVLVTHIEKAKDHLAAGTMLRALGNPNTPQGGWRWTVEQVIASIEAGSNTFFLRESSSGKRYDIKILRSKEGVPQLASFDEGHPTGHLMSLNQF